MADLSWWACFADVGVEGWLIDHYGCWAMRFHRDEQSDVSDPGVFVDYGGVILNGQAVLLKNRTSSAPKGNRDAMESIN